MTSKRRLRRKGCEGKQQFRTEAEAWGVRRAVDKAGLTGMHAYHCKFGDHWHIGHPPGPVRRSIAAKRRNRQRGL